MNRTDTIALLRNSGLDDLTGQQWDGTEKKSQNFGERTTALYKAWTAYAEAAGEKPGTRPSFRERMRAAGYAFVDHLPGDHNGKGFIGIQLTTDPVHGYEPYAD